MGGTEIDWRLEQRGEYTIILFTHEGRPVLSDLGMCRLLGLPAAGTGGTPGFLDPALLQSGSHAVGQPSPESDVYGLASSCLSVLDADDAASAGLVDVFTRAMASDPRSRPDAQRLALLVYDAAPAAPLRLTGGRASPEPAPVLTRVSALQAPQPAPRPAPPSLPRRALGQRPRRVLLGSALVLVIGFSLAAVGPAWHPGVGPGARPAPAPHWSQVMAGLDRQRSIAFARGDARQLTAVYAAGAPAGVRDRGALRRLTVAGLHADGLRLRTIEVRDGDQSRSSGRAVTLRVTDLLESYRVVDKHGALVREAPGRGRTSWVVTLRREGSRWRVYDVARG